MYQAEAAQQNTRDPKALLPFSVFPCDVALNVATLFFDCELVLATGCTALFHSCPSVLDSGVRTPGIIRLQATFLKQDLSLCWTWEAWTWWLLPGLQSEHSWGFSPHHWHSLSFLRMVVTLLSCFPKGILYLTVQYRTFIFWNVKGLLENLALGLSWANSYLQIMFVMCMSC